MLDLEKSPVAVPAFVVSLEPWHRAFLVNLRDLVLRRREPPLRLASKPGNFWPDVFVTRRLPWGGFGESVLYHLTAAAALWGFSLVWPRPLQQIRPPVFHHEDVIYYQASDYLPPLNTGDTATAAAATGEPAHAAQAIISVPPEADNHTQTIVTPPEIRLNREVPLPNVVAWDRTAPAVPLAATTQSLAQMQAPSLAQPAVAPAPDADQLRSEQAQGLQQAAVAPPPVVQAADIRRLGDLNIGHMEAVAPAPQLPVPEQRTLGGMANAGASAPAVVPPPPSVGGAVQADGRGQLIALGIHPVAPGGPVEVPNGNRRGSFAATPEGKAGAEGTPGIKTGTHGNPSGAGAGSSGKGTGTGDRVSGAPSGLYVGAAPSGSSQSAVGNGGGNGNGPGDSPNGDPNKPVEMASVAPPRVSIPVKKILAESEPEVEKRVFGDHQAYSMTVNVPNLNSAGGSWVIHFAELNSDEQKNQGELSAPVATHEVDPGYPLELMRHNVKGMVVLYAVIRKDGTVSDVRVLLSVDDQLDQYARAAFSKWRFQPATRDGSPVALEAVVSIPFRPFKRAF